MKTMCAACFERLPPRKNFEWYDEEEWTSELEESQREAMEKEREMLKMIARGRRMSICRWKSSMVKS